VGGRKRLSLAQEQLINETAQTKIIGITLETRPDCIDAQARRHSDSRHYGC
jgi:histone acetyltransferase (RNA polymerase elongator complex component)